VTGRERREGDRARGGTGLRVVVDGSGLERPRAGVGVYTTQILHAMAVERPDSRLTVFGPPGGFVHVPDASYRPLPQTRLFGRHLQWPAMIRRMKPDVYFGPAGALPLGRVGAPSVITVHDLAIYRNPRWFPAGQPLSTRLVVPRSILRADVVVAVSENTARDVVEIFGIDRSRVQVVPHGVASMFRPMAAEDLAAARERLKLPERFILFVGTIEPRKNLETLLEAWAMMRDRPDLVVVGSYGWRYESIHERIERLGPARLTHCMRWLGLAKRCLEIAQDYVNSREGFGVRLADRESVQIKLGQVAQQIQIGRLLTMHAAWKLDQGDRARKEVSMAKVHVADTLHNACDVAIQLNGARGYSKDTVLEWIYRYARQARLVDGADEVHRMVLNRALQAEGRAFWSWPVAEANGAA